MQVKNAIILHGTEDTPVSNWLSWLRDELQKEGLSVWLPQLPDTNRPNPNKVIPFILDNCPFEIAEDTILIGHSSGAVEILHLLPKLSHKIKFAFLVGSFKDNEFLKWEPLNDLFSIPFDFSKCKGSCNNFVYIHADNDPFCPLDEPKYLQSQTGGEFIIIPGQKHFTISTMGESYKKFPMLLEIIMRNI